MSEINPEKRDGKRALIRYSEEYQINAARMVLVDGFSIDKTAATLGCVRESVRRWVDIYRHRIQPNIPAMTVDEENKFLKKENCRLKMELEFLKSGSVLCERVEVKYAFINENADSFPVKVMCRLLGVSSSGTTSR